MWTNMDDRVKPIIFKSYVLFSQFYLGEIIGFKMFNSIYHYQRCEPLKTETSIVNLIVLEYVLEIIQTICVFSKLKKQWKKLYIFPSHESLWFENYTLDDNENSIVKISELICQFLVSNC